VTTVLDALDASRRISSHYLRYLESTFNFRDPALATELRAALEARSLTKGPYLEASAPFETGASVSQLMEEGVLSHLFARLRIDIDRPLYRHQEEAIRKAVISGRNVVVSTGTGSGKTETFLIPLLNLLFREVESGTAIEPGVRALLLYPMNALANDQVKRLRHLLDGVPEVTFGRYVGETAQATGQAEEDFRRRYPSEPRVPNELLSRDEMQRHPPHVLLTNYAMLEYLLLRPADSVFFDGPTGSHWRSLVLDEAHVYAGAQGTEVALLLRRLRDRVLQSERGRLQCFATSATLGAGEADHPKLVDFAERLFDESFEWVEDDPRRQDVVRAHRHPLAPAEARTNLPQRVFDPLQQAFRRGDSVDDLHGLVRSAGADDLAPGDLDTPASWLGRVLTHDDAVVAVQRRLEAEGAVELNELAAGVFDGETAERDLVALVDLAVAARRTGDDAPLLPARYHLWVGALEGGYYCLSPDHQDGVPRLVLARHKHCPSCEERGHRSVMVELGVCRNCGSAYAVGAIDARTGRIEFVTDRAAPSDYLLLDQTEIEEDDDSDAEVSTAAVDTIRCSFDTAEGTVTPGAGSVELQWIKRAGDPEPMHRCPVCSATSSGDVIFRLLSGVDAPVSVVATDLYQSLPPSSDEKQRREVGEGRKLLTFADSRQDAAYFAPYLQRTYERSVARRLISDAVRRISRGGDVPRTLDVIDQVLRLAEDDLLLDPDAGRAQNRREVGYWVAQELVGLDRRQSLSGLGLADLRVAVPRRFDLPAVLADLGFTDTEGAALLTLLLDTLRLSGAVTMPEEVDIRDERFAPRNHEIGVREQGAEWGVLGWCPTKPSRNRRLDLLERLLVARGLQSDANEVLRRLWSEELTAADSSWRDVLIGSSDRRRGVTYRLSHERLEFALADEDHLPLQCSTCRRLWWRTIDGVCPGWRCSGQVTRQVDLDDLLANHYAALYHELAPIGMAVQEHTAQWKSDKASAIQDEFTRGRLNTLSCSTTFELGVDVGEVQAVLLRNVPPRAANYVQRAGRAGRRQDSAALAVTYAQRRSHDQQQFADPRRMISGLIDPPSIILDNEPIVRRHVHAVAFAAYERELVDGGHAPHHQVEDFFLGDDGADPADEAFIAWLRTQPAELKNALARMVPAAVATEVGVESFDWADALVDPSDEEPSFGWLRRAAEEVREDLESLDQQIKEAAADEDFRRAESLKKLRATLGRRHLLGFLASRNVLPKYGFPVDVVELDVSGAGGAVAAQLDLSRDLRLAISNYAPESQVVAGKQLWRSKGIRRRAGRELPMYEWRVCRECGAFRSRLGQVAPTCLECAAADASQGGRYLHPVFGFVGRHDGEPGDGRPAATSWAETWFGSYRDDPPAFEAVPELSRRHGVERRSSRQGRITTINRGPAGRGYRFCGWCGYGEPAPTERGKRSRKEEHDDLRRPGRSCSGPLLPAQLGHEFLTDVTEIRIGGVGRGFTPDAMWSLLYALLAGSPGLGITREDLDGTLHYYAAGEAPALVLFDAVPGGAGHARFLAQQLPELCRQAMEVVATCECAPTESCYSCLRTYGNQTRHEALVRGDALALLQDLLADTEDELGEFSPLVRSLVGGAVAHDAALPIAGYELDDPAGSGWIIEAGWPQQKVGIVIDDDSQRDQWLQDDGWTCRREHDWLLADLLGALAASS
jgi:ATP-dependent helicase YprA (DUF1998 family)